MTHVSRRDDEVDVLSDVRRMIAYAFEMPGDEYEVESGLDCLCVAEHVAEELPQDLHFQCIQRVVTIRHALGCEAAQKRHHVPTSWQLRPVTRRAGAAKSLRESWLRKPGNEL